MRRKAETGGVCGAVHNRITRIGMTPDRGPRLAALGILILLLVPMAFFVISAVLNAGSLAQSSARYVLPYALRDTLFLSCGVAALSAILGAGLASLVTYLDFPGIQFLRWAAILPLAFPTYLMAYILVDIDRPTGAIMRSSLMPWLWDAVGFLLPDMRSVSGAILIFSLVLYPYVYLGTRIAFLAQGGALIETARSLGRTPFEIYRLILLPLAWPAIATSVLLVIMETLNDIGASEYVGVRTLAYTIYTTWLNRGDFAAATQLSLFLILCVLALSFGLTALANRYAHVQTRRVSTDIAPFMASRFLAPLLFCLGALPALFGFLIPSLYLVDQAVLTLTSGVDARAVGLAMYDSLRLAAFTVMIVTGVALLLIYPHRLHPDGWTRFVLRLASYGYAVPGVILGLAILIPFGAFDNWVAQWMTDFFAVNTGLLLTGSGAILVFAYLVRFASVSIGMAGAGYDKISRHFDLAARMLGRSRFTSFWLIPTRMNRTAFAAAALLVFVDVIKELPLTLILRPLGINTLATRIYEDASIGQFEQSSVKALILLLISTCAVVFVVGRHAQGHNRN